MMGLCTRTLSVSCSSPEMQVYQHRDHKNEYHGPKKKVYITPKIETQ